MNAEQRKQLGEDVKAARDQRGWSQAKLAKEAGVSENTVLSIERGDKNNQAGKIRAVMDALGIAPQVTVIDLDDIPEDVRIFLTVAAQRLKVMDDAARSRVLADVYPRLLIDS